jgi:hypothetical protein
VYRRVGPEIPKRTFRRALKDLVDAGEVVSEGRTRATRYRLAGSFGQGSGHG